MQPSAPTCRMSTRRRALGLGALGRCWCVNRAPQHGANDWCRTWVPQLSRQRGMKRITDSSTRGHRSLLWHALTSAGCAVSTLARRLVVERTGVRQWRHTGYQRIGRKSGWSPFEYFWATAPPPLVAQSSVADCLRSDFVRGGGRTPTEALEYPQVGCCNWAPPQPAQPTMQAVEGVRVQPARSRGSLQRSFVQRPWDEAGGGGTP